MPQKVMKFEPSKATPCSVSKEFLDFVASLYPEKLIHNGKTRTTETLFLCGFDVEKGYTYKEDVLIRNPDKPYQVYNTGIYNGRVRNEVEEVSLSGKIVYNKKQPHYLDKAYKLREVLTLQDLSEDIMKVIDDVGYLDFYNDGFKKVDKRVDASKPYRNIVNPS